MRSPAGGGGLAGRWHRRGLWWAAAAVSVLLLAVVAARADFALLGRLWAQADPRYALVGLAAVFCDALLTTSRFRLLHLVGRRRPYPLYLWIVSVHGYLLQGLPARLGELAYLYFMRRRLGMSPGEVAGSFVYQRILDFLVVGLFFLWGLVGVLGAGDRLAAWLPWVLGSCALLLFLYLRIEWLLQAAMGRARRFRASRRTWVAGLLMMLWSARRWAARLRGAHRRWRALALSLARWAAVMAGTWAAFRIYGVALAPETLLFVGAGLAFVSVVPLQAVGGFGVSEAGLASLLYLAGDSWQAAAATALVVRLTLVVLQLGGLGASGLLAWGLARRRGLALW